MSDTVVRTVEDFIKVRKSLELSQTEMGERLGMSLRAIQDIENGRTDLRLIHRLAAERVAMLEQKNPPKGGAKGRKSRT